MFVPDLTNIICDAWDDDSLPLPDNDGTFEVDYARSSALIGEADRVYREQLDEVAKDTSPHERQGHVRKLNALRKVTAQIRASLLERDSS